jgi:hypothetical protein
MKAIKLKSGKGLAEGTVRKEVNNAAEKITQFSSRMSRDLLYDIQPCPVRQGSLCVAHT